MKTMDSTVRADGIFLAVCLLLTPVLRSLAQTSGLDAIPVVTIQPTDRLGTWTGDTATFSVFRAGNPTPALNVYYCISGTASNGVDYQTIGNWVQLPSGVLSNSVVIKPLNLGQTDIKTVVLELCPSPLMSPINFYVGSPGRAVAYLAPPGSTKIPPAVAMVAPTNGAVFYAPASIPLLAKASDPDGLVTNVEFFAGTNDLGRGIAVVLDPPGVGGVTGRVYFLNWLNVPTNHYSLTAVAMDHSGLASTSAPVNITVQPNPPPTNIPPVVRITSPPNGAVFRAPVNIPLYAYAADLDGSVAMVEFFAGGSSLGFAHQVPTSLTSNTEPNTKLVNIFTLIWSNAPLGTNIVLSANATDNGGAATVSPGVKISVLPPEVPPTNRLAVVSIVASDPVAIEGTNCWPRVGLVDPVPTWTNWLGLSPTYRFITNCGPKSATFTVLRFGMTNDALDVAYAIGGTASNGVDYANLTGVVMIPAGQRSAAITLVPLDDGPPDLNSTVILKLKPGSTYTIGAPAAAAAIILDSRFPQPRTRMMPGNSFNLSASGPDGAWFHVEYTTDLLHWTSVCTNQVVNGSIDFVDPDAADAGARFYRTVPESGPPQ